MLTDALVETGRVSLSKSGVPLSIVAINGRVFRGFLLPFSFRSNKQKRFPKRARIRDVPEWLLLEEREPLFIGVPPNHD